MSGMCVLCARRGRTRDAGEGHCCVTCAAHLQRQVADILRLAEDAAAWVAPGSSVGGGSRPVPGSRPPLRVDALDPENTPLPPPSNATVLEALEGWERLIRSERQMVPYGPASLERAKTARKGTAASGAQAGYVGTPAVLTGVVTFLGRQVAWITTTPDFPLEDFADEIADCVRVLRRWDVSRTDSLGRIVECPHDMDGETCGYRLRIDGNDVDTYFTCPRCGSEWSVDRLMLVAAETSDAAMWLDAEAVMSRFGVDRKTLERWVRTGRLEKSHGLYDIKPIALARRRGA